MNASHLSVRIKTMQNKYYGEKVVNFNNLLQNLFLSQLFKKVLILPCWAIS